MNPYVLAALILGPVFAFFSGALIGNKTLAVFRLRVFQDLDHLVGMVEEITAITNDRRIVPGVITDRVQEIKYGLGVPERDMWLYEDHPA